MAFGTTFLPNQAPHYANIALGYVQHGKEATLSFLNQSLPNALTEKVAEVANSINMSFVNNYLLENVGVTLSGTTSMLLGVGAGSSLAFNRPLLAAALIVPAIGVTKDTTEISTALSTSAISVVTFLAARGAKIIFHK